MHKLCFSFPVAGMLFRRVKTAPTGQTCQKRLYNIHRIKMRNLITTYLQVSSNSYNFVGMNITINVNTMKKFLLIVAAMLLLIPFANAQISDGQPSSKTIRTGNRPKAGNFGLYIGLTSDIAYNLKGISDDGGLTIPLPLINFKYMDTNNFELRIGLDSFSKGKSQSAKTVADPDLNIPSHQISSSTYDLDLMFYPGVAYHFNSKNILDVYIGAELPIGGKFNQEKQVQDDQWRRSNTSAFKIGLGAFVGLQVFVANLPLALGLEYGLSANGTIGGKTKMVAYDGNDKQTRYYAAGDTTPYSKLRMSEGIFGQQVRVTLSYYFK